MSVKPSASVATIGRPAASASKAVRGVPSQSEGKTTISNEANAPAHVAREPGEADALRDPKAARLSLELVSQLPLSHDAETHVGSFVKHELGRLDDEPIALRGHQSRDRAADRQPQ